MLTGIFLLLAFAFGRLTGRVFERARTEEQRGRWLCDRCGTDLCGGVLCRPAPAVTLSCDAEGLTRGLQRAARALEPHPGECG